MSELAVKLQQDLEKKFDHLCFVHDQTALHVANEFFELRNQIDIAAEELLARQQETQNDEEPLSEAKPSLSKQEITAALKELKKKHKKKLAKKNKSGNSKKNINSDLQLVIGKLEKRLFDDADEDVNVNEIRDEYIKILRELEQRCLHQLPKTKRPSLDVTYCHFKQRIESLNECQSDRLEETYKELALEIIEETYQLERRLLGEETVFYVSSSKENQLGRLVHIGGDRLRRLEVDCLTKMSDCSVKLSQPEKQVQMQLQAHLKSLLLVEFKPQTHVDNNYLIMIRLVYHFDTELKTSTPKYIYLGKPELQYSDNSARNSSIEQQVVKFRLPENFGELQLHNIAGITSEFGLMNLVQKELHFTESKIASLDFLAYPQADRLKTLILSEIRLERFDENLISRCVNLKKLKIDIYGEGVVITSLEFLRPLRKLSSLVLSFLNFDIDLSVLKDFQYLTVLSLCGAYDSSGKAAYPKINIDGVLRQLSFLPSLVELQFLLLEIDKVDRQQFAGFKCLQNVTFFDTRGCKKLTESADFRKTSRALFALDVRFISGDTDIFQYLLSLL